MAASAVGASASGGTGGSRVEPSVYWGKRDVRSVTRAPARGRMVGDFEAANPGAPRARTSTETLMKSLSEAQGEFYRWSDTERRKWADHLFALGLIDEDETSDYATLKGMWDDVVAETANFTTAGKRLSPWEVASLVAGGEAGAAARKAANAKKAPFTGAKSQRSTSVDLTDPKTAKALMNDTLSRVLGRAATDDEIDTFKGVLNAAERANPTTTVSTTNYVAGDAVSQSSTTSGGLTGQARQQMAQDQAMSAPEYGAYQAASTYFNAFLATLGS